MVCLVYFLEPGLVRVGYLFVCASDAVYAAAFSSQATDFVRVCNSEHSSRGLEVVRG